MPSHAGTLSISLPRVFWADRTAFLSPRGPSCWSQKGALCAACLVTSCVLTGWFRWSAFSWIGIAASWFALWLGGLSGLSATCGTRGWRIRGRLEGCRRNRNRRVSRRGASRTLLPCLGVVASKQRRRLLAGDGRNLPEGCNSISFSFCTLARIYYCSDLTHSYDCRAKICLYSSQVLFYCYSYCYSMSTLLLLGHFYSGYTFSNPEDILIGTYATLGLTSELLVLSVLYTLCS